MEEVPANESAARIKVKRNERHVKLFCTYRSGRTAGKSSTTATGSSRCTVAATEKLPLKGAAEGHSDRLQMEPRTKGMRKI
jgi:hypothetical protein